MSTGYWIGVDLGGTKILTGLFDDALQLVARAKSPTQAEDGPAGVFGRIGQAVESILREGNVEPSQVRGLGFGIPGQIEPHTTTVRFAPNLDWRNLDVQAHLPAGWTWPVVLENDVRMGTYGEFTHGAAKGARHVFGIFVGTGVGGGLILNGDLYTGFNGHGGEIGHVVCHWRRGTSLEDIAGRRSQMKRAKKLLDDAPKRTRKDWKGVDLDRVKSSQLAEFYHRHDPIAVRLIDDAARAVGAAVASVVNLLSPEVVVVGGGVAQAVGESFLERVWELAQKFALPDATRGMRCVPAALGDDSGIIGCAAYAKSKLGRTPAVMNADWRTRYDLAVTVAREAGDLAKRIFDTGCEVEWKADQSPVTVADKRAEEHIRTAIKQHFPADGFLGEEYADEPGTSGYRWVIDPIDGTRAFVRQIPIWGTLLGLEYRDDPIAGVAYAPALGNLWRALRGDGAYRDDKKLSVSAVEVLSKAFLSYSGVNWFKKAGYLPQFLDLCNQTERQRGIGDFYGFMLVAQGSIDVMVDHGVHAWDVAALIPIVEEAGGTFTDWAGDRTIHSTDVLATNGPLHQLVRRVLTAGSSVL